MNNAFTVQEIAEELHSFHNPFMPAAGFIQAAEEWIVEGHDRIATHLIDTDAQHVIVVVQDNQKEWEAGQAGMHNDVVPTYSIIRIFPSHLATTTWRVSVDHKGLDAETTMHNILQGRVS